MSKVAETPPLQLPETRVENYQALSVMAMVCLVAGILSVAALAHPVFWAFPVVAVLTGLLALRRIRRSEGELTGETPATAGMTLGAVFLLAGFGAYYVPRWHGKREASNLGFRFLQYLQAGETKRAINLTNPPGYQLPENANFTEVFARERKEQKRLASFVAENPIVRALGRLGGKSTISLYDIEAYGKIEGEEGAYAVYKIDYEEGNERQQFLVMLHCAYRRNVKKPTEGGWFIRNITGPPYTPRSVRVREAAVHEHGGGGDEHDH